MHNYELLKPKSFSSSDEPKGKEILIKLSYVSLEDFDAKYAEVGLPSSSCGYGEVIACGPEVKMIESGDKVLYVTKQPVLLTSQYALVEAESVVKISDGTDVRPILASLAKAMIAKFMTLSVFMVRKESNVLIMNAHTPLSCAIAFFAHRCGASKILGISSTAIANKSYFSKIQSIENSASAESIKEAADFHCAYLDNAASIDIAAKLLLPGGLVVLSEGIKMDKIDVKQARSKSLFFAAPMAQHYFFNDKGPRLELIDIVELIKEGACTLPWEEFSISDDNIQIALGKLKSPENNKSILFTL